ncbi:cytosolic Cu/Zn superoxide dismutase [Whalleya microplaca]|nr:cytosolic Cu/Zn superoxide dismutase [Whalleya microplaca]
MYVSLALTAVGSACLAGAQVQGSAPDPQVLNATQSGVLPVLPTPFDGVEILEGSIVDQGRVNPGFAGLTGPAEEQTDLPATTYTATLPATMFNPFAGDNLTGTITGVGTSQGVQFTIIFDGFPNMTYGPFGYQIHDLAVPADGNCTSTMGHLDPTNRGEYFPCEMSQSQTCQAGDLAGKHGMVTNSTSFSASYVDPYLSTDPDSAYFFGDKSIVIRTRNATRLTCANFKLTSNATPTGTSVPTMMPNSGASTMSATHLGIVAVSVAVALFKFTHCDFMAFIQERFL